MATKFDLVPILYVDPTGTLMLRDRFAKDVAARYDRLVGGIKTIAEKERDRDRLVAMVDKQANQTVLQEVRGAPWTNIYIAGAWHDGVSNARNMLTSAGYKPPKNVAPLTQIYSLSTYQATLKQQQARTFDDLKGVTRDMSRQIAQIMDKALRDGLNPRETGEILAATVRGGRGQDLGITDSLGRYIPAQRRAEMIARTETIRAHHLATVEEYRHWGVLGVTVQAEWVSAGDRRVCPQCRSLTGRVYTLDEIEGMIPAHPNCRCISIPVEVPARRARRGAPLRVVEPAEVPETPAEVLPGMTFSSPTEAREALKEYGLNLVMPGGVAPPLEQLQTVGKAIRDDIYRQFPQLRKQLVKAKDVDLIIARTEYVGERNLSKYTWWTEAEKPNLLEIGQRVFSLPERSPASLSRPFGSPRWSGPLDPAYAVRHEYGHHVDIAVMTDKQRSSWKVFFEKNRNDFGRYVGAYSRTNSLEGFAEAFAIYTDPLYGKYPQLTLPKSIEAEIRAIVGTRRRMSTTKIRQTKPWFSWPWSHPAAAQSVAYSEAPRDVRCSARLCKHFIGFTKSNPICEAFPDGIPGDIAYRDNPHYTRDARQKNRVVYDRREETESKKLLDPTESAI